MSRLDVRGEISHGEEGRHFQKKNFITKNFITTINLTDLLISQVRGFKPGRSRRIFQGEKNPQHAFFRKGSKTVRPMS